MTLDENFQYLTDQIDLTSLMDWYICRSYMGDRDTANVLRDMQNYFNLNNEQMQEYFGKVMP